MRWPCVLLPFLLILVTAGATQGAGPADDLLALVPPNAGATLVIEDLRGLARDFFASPVSEGLRELPAVKTWFASERYLQFSQARREIEAALGAPFAEIRDDLLGDAVVLTLQPPADGGAGEPRGLLLLRFRDRALLDRLIATSNESEKQSGHLLEVLQRRREGIAYSVRSFRPGTKPDEAYAVLPGDIFAWSNSEALVLGAIDRQGGKPGLGQDPRFRKVRSQLPDRSAVSLFANPPFLDQLLTSAPPSSPSEERLRSLLRRYLAAVEYVGAAAEWRDGVLLHIREALDPGRLGEPLKRWAARPGGTAALVCRVPPSALAVAAANIDFGAVAAAMLSLAPEAARPKVDNLLLALRGLLLDKDPRSEILPHLGPGLVVYLDDPAGARRPPVVAAITLEGGPEVAAAIDNALRTLLAFIALDPKRSQDTSRVEMAMTQGVRVTTLPGLPFAFAIDRGLLVLGQSPEAIASYLRPDPPAGLGDRFERFRTAYFPRAESFAYIDLERFYAWASAHREELARWLAIRPGASGGPSRRDLEDVLALLALFRGAFATSTLEPDGTAARRTVGLIAKDQSPKP
ncbi:MAG: hypothetical protein IRY99_05895 [Isosphaeraceae bacterium]|nr:hypothetical protein [Isosphaeraceae bacterium]